MKYLWIAPVVALAFAAVPLAAQTEAGKYPENRVRFERDNPVHVPDEVYVVNRVVLRSLDLRQSGNGLQFSGEVITDFDADIVPSDEEDIIRGQQPVSIDIQLVHFHTQIRRQGGAAQDPRVNPTNPAARSQQVPGQFATATADQRLGMFGLATFALPPLTKPLAPGIYAIQARVTFAAQPGSISRAIKYCSDWYGEENVGQDPVTFDEIFESVRRTPASHEKFYDQILYSVGSTGSTALVFIGDIARDGVIDLVPPGRDGEEANYLLWVPIIETADLVESYEFQLANVDAIIDEQLEAKKRTDFPIRPEHREADIKRRNDAIERWEEEAKSEKEQIRRTNRHMIARLGGATTEEERALVRIAKAARPALIEQIAVFEESLTARYWELAEAHLNYGWHRVNAPGSFAWNAIDRQNIKARSSERLEKLRMLRENRNEGLNKVWEEREQTFRYYPKEIRDIAFAYLKDRDETDAFDSEKFCETVGGTVELDIAKWREYRANFRNDFLEKTEALLQQVATTRRYANQVWPDALQHARTARDAVISLAYSYEYFIRTAKHEHSAEQVMQSWREEDAQHPTLDLSQFYTASQAPPLAVKTRFDGAVRSLRSVAGVDAFAAQSRAAAEAAARHK